MTKKFAESVRTIRKITSGYTASRILLTASNYGIFDHLKKPVNAKGLSKKLSLDERATEILLDALSALGFLKKTKNGYQNTKASSVFLMSNSPLYQGDILAHHDSLWHRWSDLDSVLKTGKPSSKKRYHESFIKGMHNLSVLRAPQVVSLLDLKGVRRVLDLGGGPGTYSVEFAQRGTDVTLFDVKETFRIAKEIISSSKIKGTIEFKPGDFLMDDIGKGYDLVFVSQIFHAYDDKENISLLRKIRRSLNKNGRVVIQEFLVNDNRTGPLPGALFAVNMLVGTSQGRTYPPSEMIDWLRKTGFKSFKKSLHEDNVLIEARKASR